MTIPSLREYQQAANRSVPQHFFEKGQNRILWKLPTGTGKTVCFAQLPNEPDLKTWLDTFSARGAFMLVIAHREELLNQAREKIQAANPGLMVSIEQGELVANRYSNVIVASIQTLSAMKYRRLKRLLQYHTFRLVVVDEAHHAAAASYRTVLALLGFLPMADATEAQNIEAATFDDVDVMTKALAGWDLVAQKDRLLLGVTATPNRSDAIGLSCVFQSIAYSYALKQAIEDGWLVPIQPWVIETTASLEAVRTSHGDFNQKDLADAVNNPARNALSVSAWQEHAAGLSTIAFTVDVAHAHALAEMFRAKGIPAEAISGETPKDDRRNILRRYTAGTVEVICNCMVLIEGTDLPRTECILHAKPTKSATLFEQMTGRGLRIHPGKSRCVVIDMVDVAKKHSLQAAPVLYGLPPGLVANGKDLRQVADDFEAFREKYPNFDLDAALLNGHFTLEQLGAKATTFDVWTVPTLGELAAVVSMNWIKTAVDTFRLQYPWSDGVEALSVQPDVLGHFDVALTLRTPQPHPEGGAPRYQTRQRTIAAQVDNVVEALRIAEQFIEQERRSVMKLKDREAPWRMRPASQKQIAYLEKLRVPFNRKTITMGGASDLLDLANSRRGR